MDAWHKEVVELHEFFEAYFLGTTDMADLHLLEAVLAPGFTIVGPNGTESSRAETIEAIRGGHGHTSSLVITITEARLLSTTAETVVARYVENHALSEGSNHRLSTVVFTRVPDAPNGLQWQSVHETWVAGTRN
jgi:hypothetical protein